MFPFLESWVSILAILGNKVMKEFKSGCVFEVPWHHWSEMCFVTSRTRKSCSRRMKIMFIDMLLMMVHSKLIIPEVFRWVTNSMVHRHFPRWLMGLCKPGDVLLDDLRMSEVRSVTIPYGWTKSGSMKLLDTGKYGKQKHTHCFLKEPMAL